MLLKYLTYLLSIALVVSCQKEVKTAINDQGKVQLHFNPVIKAAALDFTSTYTNDHHEDYTVRAFKFYIHKIELIKENDEVICVSNDYHLLDASDPASLIIEARVAAASYKALAFSIGVDSARNVSGAQSGALDPANGMFWTWSTGYIMAKFEGSSPVSSQPGNRFEYHIGGFQGNDNVVKSLRLDLPGFNLAKERTASININADANKFFSAANSLPISSNPVCMTPGTLAKAFAENYYTMFSVTGIEND